MAQGSNLPLPQSPFVDPKTGALSYDGYQYLLSLLNATASQTSTITNSLTSAGTNQATALPLSSQWNEVDNVPAGTGVLLSSYQPGQSQVVFNQGLLNLLIYPPPGFSIDSLGTNNPYTLASLARITFDFVSFNQIRS